MLQQYSNFYKWWCKSHTLPISVHSNHLCLLCRALKSSNCALSLLGFHGLGWGEGGGRQGRRMGSRWCLISLAGKQAVTRVLLGVS